MRPARYLRLNRLRLVVVEYGHDLRAVRPHGRSKGHAVGRAGAGDHVRAERLRAFPAVDDDELLVRNAGGDQRVFVDRGQP